MDLCAEEGGYRGGLEGWRLGIGCRLLFAIIAACSEAIMPRKNGLSLPLHPLQILSWTVISLMIAANYLLVRPSLSNALQVLLT